MNFEDCLRKGLIKKDSGVKTRAKASIEIAKRFHKSAQRNMEIHDYEIVEIAAYNSAFHAARALLFQKGYRERSHYCLAIALRDLYKEKDRVTELINAFDRLRFTRHNVQYSGKLIKKEEADFALEFAIELIEEAEKIIA